MAAEPAEAAEAAHGASLLAAAVADAGVPAGPDGVPTRRKPLSRRLYPWFSDAELALPPSAVLPDSISKRLSRADAVKMDPAAYAEELASHLRLLDALVGELYEDEVDRYLPRATATVYFRVFYARRAVQEFGMLHTVVASVFLAGKVEEKRVKLENVTTGLEACYQRTMQQVLPPSETGKKLRDDVLAREAVLLETVEYTFQLVHPYGFISSVVSDTYGGDDVVLDAKRGCKARDLRTASSMMVYTSLMRTAQCLRYPPHCIAVAALWVAHRIRRVPQPRVRSDLAGGGHLAWYRHWGVPLPLISAIVLEWADAAEKKADGDKMRKLVLPDGDDGSGPDGSVDVDAKWERTRLRAWVGGAGGAATSPTGAPERAARVAQVEPCPRCGEKFTKAGYAAHRDACKARYTVCLRCKLPYVKADEAEAAAHRTCAERSRCKVCQRLFSDRTEFEAHYAACKKSAAASGLKRKTSDASAGSAGSGAKSSSPKRARRTSSSKRE